MRWFYFACVFISCLPLAAQTATSTNQDPFHSLSFLEGTWDASVQNNGAVTRSGRYTFQRELDGHILARHSTNDPSCKSPANFDCSHGDLLYVYQDSAGEPLKAIYFDNEGHVIRYEVSTPTSNRVVFLSTPGAGPRFQLTYELKSDTLTGRFEMEMPGQSDWHTYLEWSGGRR